MLHTPFAVHIALNVPLLVPAALYEVPAVVAGQVNEQLFEPLGDGITAAPVDPGHFTATALFGQVETTLLHTPFTEHVALIVPLLVPAALYEVPAAVAGQVNEQLFEPFGDGTTAVSVDAGHIIGVVLVTVFFVQVAMGFVQFPLLQVAL